LTTFDLDNGIDKFIESHWMILENNWIDLDTRKIYFIDILSYYLI